MIKVNKKRSGFPSHLVDPRKKDSAWILQYIKAAYDEFDSNGYEAWGDKRRNIKDYAQGKQSINKYKPIMGVDSDASDAWMAIDWSVLPIIPRFRRVALNRIGKMGYNMTATPIDAVAEQEKNDYFIKQEARLRMREEMAKVNPELIQKAGLTRKPGEAEDLEELKIQKDWTWKHNAAIEMETATELIYNNNYVDELIKQVDEDNFDYGMSGFRSYIDSNNSIKIRKVSVPSLITNHCQKRDFSDLRYAGEVLNLTIADLKQWAGDKFDEKQYEEIAKKWTGKLSNPTAIPKDDSFARGYDDFRIQVLDMEFYSDNESVYEKRKNRKGNPVTGKTQFYKKQKEGSKKQIKRVSYKVVYKGCWIIDSDFIFNEGLCTNMQRVKTNLTDVRMSFHLFAYNFWEMRTSSIMEQLIPIADAIQIAWYRIQHCIAEAVPKGLQIDLDALEDIPLGKNGSQLTPMEIISLFKQKGVLIYRSKDLEGNLTNYKPIAELENGVSGDLERYTNIINFNMNLVRSIIGLNEATDGSSPDPRMLTTTANMAEAGSNNALYSLILSRKKLLEDMAESTILKLQDVMKRGGKVAGYVTALGKGTKKWFELSPNISRHEYGFKLEDKATPQQKEILRNMMMAKLGEDTIELEDAFFIESIDNLKIAEQVLSYRVKKRKEKKQQEAMQMQQMNTQAQIQSAQSAEAMKQETLKLEYALKKDLLVTEKELEKEIKSLEMGARKQIAESSDGNKAIAYN